MSIPGLRGINCATKGMTVIGWKSIVTDLAETYHSRRVVSGQPDVCVLGKRQIGGACKFTPLHSFYKFISMHAGGHEFISVI